MTNEANREWWITQYDKYFADNGKDALDKARDAAAHRYADGLDNGTLTRPKGDVIAEGRARFDQYVTHGERKNRRNNFHNDLEELLAALNGETILGAEDPLLARVYPIGDGTDACVVDWTVPDWEYSVKERYRNAGDVMNAATSYDREYAQEIIDRLTALHIPSARRKVDPREGNSKRSA